MFLVSQPLLDSLARGPVLKPASQWRALPPPTLGIPPVLAPFVVYLVQGLLLVSVVVFPPPWFVKNPLVMFAVPVVCAVLDIGFARWTATRPWWPDAKEWFPQFLLFMVAHAFYVLLLLLLVQMALLRQKTASWTLEGVAGALG